MKTLIKNCRIISPDMDIAKASVEIDGAFIKRIYTASEKLPKADKIIDAKGKILMPGFIDIHTHGAAGCDVTDATPKAISTIAAAKVKEGITTLVPTTLTIPENGLAKALKAVAAYMKKKSPEGPKVPGVHLEGPFINPKCAGAQNPAYARKADIEEIKRLDAIAKVMIVSYAVETEGAYEFTTKLLSMGIVPSCGHSAATYEQFRQASCCGLKHLTHFCNQMTPLHHREIGLVGSGLLDNNILIEIICDKKHVCSDMIRLAFKSKPIDKIAIITDSLSASWMPDGPMKLGGLDVMVENGTARLKQGGNLAGSTLKYNEGLKNIYEITGLPLCQLIKTTSLNQAHSMALEKVAKIEAGYYADIVILNENFDVSKVFVNGRLTVNN